MRTVGHLVASLRPLQWVKNGFVLLPLLFSQQIFNHSSLLQGIQAALIFCLLSSSIYLLNDIVDLEADRRHPIKSRRPLAAGQISIPFASATMGILMAGSLLWGFILGAPFFATLVIYLFIQILYNVSLKSLVILDIFCVSSGFFLRVIAGAAAIQAAVSHWLIICTILISMLLTMGKRRHELIMLGDGDATNHRKVLSKYSPYLLDQMIGVITGSTILSYMLYCISPETISKFHTDHLIYTVPFVLYGIFRYLYLIHQENEGGEPERLIISDIPLLVCVGLWGITCMVIIYRIV